MKAVLSAISIISLLVTPAAFAVQATDASSKAAGNEASAPTREINRTQDTVVNEMDLNDIRLLADRIMNGGSGSATPKAAGKPAATR